MTDQGSYHVSSFSANMQAEIRRLDAQVDLFWRSEHELLREFGMRDGIDYLDCGCGPGRLIELVKSTYPATRCQGVEMDPILVQAANAYLDAFLEAKIDLVPWGYPCERIEGGMFTGRNSAQDTCEAGVPSGVNIAHRGPCSDTRPGGDIDGGNVKSNTRRTRSGQ